MSKQIITSKEEINEILVDFASDFLIPTMSDMMDEKLDQRIGDFRIEVNQQFQSVNKKFAEQEHNLKSYIDNKLADYTSDIFKRLDKQYQKDRDYKQKVIEILKKNKLGTSEEIAFLQGFVQAS